MNRELKPLNILVVEDNPGDYILLKDFLELTNLPVNTIFHAVNLKAVPVLVDHYQIDIALLDLSLPDSSGIDSVISLNKLLPKTPIIVFSGLTGIEIAMQSISVGAQDYLVKGEFDEKLLEKTIQYSLERKKILENLKNSNERYEFINKATLDTIWDFDFNKNIGHWGEGIIHDYGYSADDLEYNNKMWMKMIHPDDQERVSKNIRYHISNKLEYWRDEYRIRTASGSYKDVFGRGFILFDAEGKAYRMYGAIQDITERKRLQKELLNQQLFAQKMITDVTIRAQEKERNELGKELHDNINQILATVKMYIGMVRSKREVADELVERSYQYVNEAMEEIRKLSKTLVAPSLGDISLEEALDSLAQQINVSHQLKVDLIYEVEERQEIEDKKQLMIYRIVQEQMNNIIKHSKASEATIAIRNENNELYLSIIDNGKGFNPSEKAKGIGLQNISSRVEFYSGAMNINSEPGKGCEIEIRIPL